MSGRLIGPGEEWLNEKFGDESWPDDVNATDLTLAMMEAGDDYLRHLGYDWDAFGAFRPDANQPIEGSGIADQKDRNE